MMMKAKKGNIMDNLGALGVGIAALAVTLVVVFLILSQTAANTTVAADGNATAALTTLALAADDIPGWVPLIVIAVIGALLLSLVAMFKQRT